MAAFPTLKTGAVAQYPAERQMRFSTQIVEFVDGREQRFRDFARPLRRWVIRLALLDASELQSVIDFVANAGSSSFSFKDPWAGTLYANCTLEGAESAATLVDEWNAQTQLTIRENRT
jgi:hypothetical protein